MTEAISFDSIPASIRHPGAYTEYNTRFAVNTLPTNPQKVLIIAPQTTGTIAPLTPITVFSDSEAEAYFGAGSWAHLMTRFAIRNNQMLTLTVMGVADNSAGVAATGTLTLAGTASSAGVLTVTVSGADYKIAIAKGETDKNVATRIAAVINGKTDAPAQAAANEKVVTLTAKCKGDIGNEITINAISSAAGLTIEAADFSGGQANAELAPALAKIAGEHYNVMISAFSDDKNALALKEHLDAVSSPIEKMPSIGVLGYRGTMSQGTTFTGKLNSERLTVAWYKGALQPSPLIAAGYGAVIAYEEDPARPLNTLEVKGLTAVDETQRPNFTEKNQALYNGLTPLVVVNSRVQILRAITTYTKSATGTDDPAFLDLTTIRTLDYVRYAIEQRLALRFPRDKLSSRTKAKVRSEILDVLLRLETLEIVDNVEANKSKLIVEPSSQDVNRLDCAIPTDVVNGLHVIANRIDLIL